MTKVSTSTARAAAEITEEDRRFAYSAEGSYLALSKAKTGMSMPPDSLLEKRKESARLLQQSHAIAEKMGGAGFDCYRKTPYGLYRYYVHSRHVEKLPSFRRVIFIPHLAQSVRAPLVTALEAHLESAPYARMWTFTTGQRTPLRRLAPDVLGPEEPHLRRRCEWLHRKLSDLNAQAFMRRAGLEIIFRSTELGTPEINERGDKLANGGEIETDESGRIYFHVHAHVVVSPSRFLPPKAWDSVLKSVGKFWKFWWKDGSETRSGLIANPRECCKYITKPGEMLKLSGGDLVALQAQLSRLKLAQPMGALATEIKARKLAGNRLVKDSTPDGPVHREVKDWNKHGRQTEQEKNQAAAAKLARAEKAAAQRVVSRLLPGFGPAGVAEPRVVVMALNFDEPGGREHAAGEKPTRRDDPNSGESFCHEGSPTPAQRLL